MKHIALVALIALPGLAQASLGPLVNHTEADIAGNHHVDLALSLPYAAPTPGCDSEKPDVSAPVFACAVFPVAQ